MIVSGGSVSEEGTQLPFVLDPTTRWQENSWCERSRGSHHHAGRSLPARRAIARAGRRVPILNLPKAHKTRLWLFPLWREYRKKSRAAEQTCLAFFHKQEKRNDRAVAIWMHRPERNHSLICAGFPYGHARLFSGKHCGRWAISWIAGPSDTISIDLNWRAAAKGRGHEKGDKWLLVAVQVRVRRQRISGGNRLQVCRGLHLE